MRNLHASHIPVPGTDYTAEAAFVFLSYRPTHSFRQQSSSSSISRSHDRLLACLFPVHDSCIGLEAAPRHSSARVAWPREHVQILVPVAAAIQRATACPRHAIPHTSPSRRSITRPHAIKEQAKSRWPAVHHLAKCSPICGEGSRVPLYLPDSWTPPFRCDHAPTRTRCK